MEVTFYVCTVLAFVGFFAKGFVYNFSTESIVIFSFKVLICCVFASTWIWAGWWREVSFRYQLVCVCFLETVCWRDLHQLFKLVSPVIANLLMINFETETLKKARLKLKTWFSCVIWPQGKTKLDKSTISFLTKTYLFKKEVTAPSNSRSIVKFNSRQTP